MLVINLHILYICILLFIEHNDDVSSENYIFFVLITISPPVRVTKKTVAPQTSKFP